MKISIIIPVYNEEKTLAEILKRVRKAKLPKYMEKEIVIVDDGSSDETKNILAKTKTSKKLKIVSHSTNLGKGAAVRTGLGQATGDIFLIQDADLEYHPRDYPKLLRPILSGKTKVVYGSRLMTLGFKPFGNDKTPFVTHYLTNRFLSFLTNLLYGSNLTDMETGYKVFTRQVYQSVKPLRSNHFDFEPEITAKILKNGFAIQEVPIMTIPRGYDEGKKITWKDGIIACLSLIKYRLRS